MLSLPIVDLTEEELEKLKIIKEKSGSGWIRGFKVKAFHVCPRCHEAPEGGWKGNDELLGLTCTNCEHNLSWYEWKDLETVLRWEGPY